MRKFWLYDLLVLCGLGVIVLAETNSGSSCNVSYTGQETVPELCLSAQDAAARLLSRVLNFTLADNGSLIFDPLPPTRQVSVEVEDGSDRLKTWSSLANSFVDAVRSGSLPYDVILPALNSSVDSPIATADCMSDQRNTGSGDFEFRDILQDFGGWWAPILVVTALGPVFALLFLITGCCFCCCRLCGNCGGSLTQEYRNSNSKICVLLCVMLTCCIIVLCVGVAFAFISNEQINESIRNFDNTVNKALDSSLNFVDDVQMQANTTVDRYEEINTFLQCQVDNSHITIGRVILNTFEDSVAPLINSSLELAVDLNDSINALQLVNVTVEKLQDLTQRLQTELDGLEVMLETLDTNCRNATSLGNNCTAIPTQSFSVVNYTLVDDVSVVLNRLLLIDDIGEQALEANSTFYGIPCDIRNQIQEQAQEILDQADEFQDTIMDIANDIEMTLNDVLNEEGFIGDIRSQSHDIQSSLDQYDTPRYVVSILICLLILIVIIVLIVALLCGGFGFRRDTMPSKRTRLSNCGGLTLIYLGVPLTFIFAFILLFLASITFFLGANMLKVCYSIAEDPANDDIPSYELFSQIIDNSDLWGGYLLGCFLLDDSSIPLTVADMLNGCKANQPIYQVAQLSLRPNLNLEEVTNITNQIPNLDQLFADLEESVEFNPDQILTQETRNSLNSFSNAGLETIDYTQYMTQIASQISTLGIDSTISTLETIQNGFTSLSQTSLANDTQDIISEITRINQTTIAEISNYTELLEQQIIMLNETALLLNGTVQGVLDDANAAFAQINGSTGSQLVLNQTRRVLDYFITYATDFANWAINNLENEIGRCRPLYATYNNLYYEACVDAVDGINGLWLAIGLCVLFFIPTLVFSICVSQYLRRMKESDSWPDAYAPSRQEFVCMENIGTNVGKQHLYHSKVDDAVYKALGSIPSHWNEQPIGANDKPEVCHIVTLDSDSDEYKRALQKFQETLPSTICTIVAVKRIQNPQLFRQYNTMKADMKENVPDVCQLERELFHGTKKEACDKINHQGFNRMFAGTNAAVYGKGVYFAVHAGYSSQETYSPKDDYGFKYIYSCLVLTGEYTTGNSSMTVPPAKNEQNPSILYDSLVDNKNNPNIFVAVKDGQVYPQYLIVFKMKY